jgi:hypothetical protein
MVRAKEGIFDSQSAGPPSPGFDYAAMYKKGNALGQTGIDAQTDAIGYYDQMAQGLGPSVAERQLQMQAEQNNRAAMQLAGQARGGNIAGMYSQALGAQAGAQAQTNQQAAILRAQEQQQAMAGLGQLGGQVAQQGMGYDELAQRGLIAAGQQNIDWQLGKRGLNLQEDAQQFGQNMQIANTIMKGAGSVIGGAVMSDERAKVGIQPTAQSASAAIGEVDPITFRYQPGLGPDGQQFGASAQQLETTSLGPQLVREGPDGFKRIDTGGAAMASLAAAAEHERRLRDLEMLAGAGEARKLASGLGPSRGANPLQPTVSGPIAGAA